MEEKQRMRGSCKKLRQEQRGDAAKELKSQDERQKERTLEQPLVANAGKMSPNRRMRPQQRKQAAYK